MQSNKVGRDPLETISDETTEYNESDSPIDKFNNVRIDQERKGSIDITKLKGIPTARVNVREDSLESSASELFSQQQRSEL